MFRNFDVRGGPDKTMIYLTLFAHACLVKCERIEDKNQGRGFIELDMFAIMFIIIYTILHTNFDFSLLYVHVAIKDLRAMATKQFAIPGESGWPLGGLFAAPEDRKEAGERIMSGCICVYVVKYIYI